MGRLATTSVKVADTQGRITLGKQYANRTVIVEERSDKFVVRLVREIPEREAWLYENEKAIAAVRRGLRQAKAGRFARRGPDLKAAAEVARQLQDP